MVSNNDRTVKFFDISLQAKSHSSINGMSTRLPSAGELHLEVPVNHCEYMLSTSLCEYFDPK